MYNDECSISWAMFMHEMLFLDASTEMRGDEKSHISLSACSWNCQKRKKDDEKLKITGTREAKNVCYAGFACFYENKSLNRLYKEGSMCE